MFTVPKHSNLNVQFPENTQSPTTKGIQISGAGWSLRGGEGGGILQDENKKK